MWQARHIASLLEAAGYSIEIIDIVTIGDKILDRSLSKIGAKGVFTEELETMLRNGEIDIAQHSAKDLPSTLAADLPLIAFTKREAAHDVVLSLNPDSFSRNKSLPCRNFKYKTTRHVGQRISTAYLS
jgi:hydroxymethylbilane synthase